MPLSTLRGAPPGDAEGTTTMNTKTSLLLAAGLALSGAAGCEDIEPGDYVVYRIASTEADESSSCNLTANEIDDSSTLKASGTLILFAGEEGEYFLDLGSLALVGELVEDGDTLLYDFSGKTVDIEWSNPEGSGTQITTTVSHSLEFDVDDELVTGVYKVKHTVDCAGSGNSCDGVPWSCSETTDFVGTEVEDVDLQHHVD
jgi:hypothetical protein